MISLLKGWSLRLKKVGLAGPLFILGLVCGLLIWNSATTVLAAAVPDGAVDTFFRKGTGTNGIVRTTVVQNDGKILIAGDFTTYNGVARNHIARLNPDGTLDTTFLANSAGAAGNVLALAIQSDQKILLVGEFTSYNGITRNRIARLNTDGTLDITFLTSDVGANNVIHTVAIQSSDGKIIIGGEFISYNGIIRNRLARLNTDGTLDTTFLASGNAANDTVFIATVQSDGKILFGGNFTFYNNIFRSGLARANADGTLDTTFNPGSGLDNKLYAIVVQSNGKILLGGEFTDYNGVARNRVARINTDGTLDTTFNPGNGAGSPQLNHWVNSIAVQSDGKILLVGTFPTYNSINRANIARVNADGTLDTTFDPGTGSNGTLIALTIQNNGKILTGGMFSSYNGSGREFVARINTEGTLDTTFESGTASNGIVRTIVVQNDSKILLSGDFTAYDGITRTKIARLNPDGTLDTTFLTNGVGADKSIVTTALQNNGKIVIGGDFTTYNGITRTKVARLNTDGTLDTTFLASGEGANSIVRTVAVQNDGKIVIGGDFTTYNGVTRTKVARLNTDGTLDTTFLASGSAANDSVFIATVQNDGKILLGGDFTNYNGVARNRLARINTDGTLDTTFNPGGGIDNKLYAIVVQSNGKILLGGEFTNYNGVARNHIARINADGTLDTTFNPGSGAGVAGVNHWVNSIAVQSDGKIMLVGTFPTYNNINRANIARVYANGTLDTTFDPGTGPNGTVIPVAIQADNKILLGGLFTMVDSYKQEYISRLQNRSFSNVVLTSNPNPANLGDSVTFTATVSPITATGTVTFTFGGTTAVSSTLSNGLATYVTSTLPAGVITLTASYSGDAGNGSNISSIYSQTVIACDPLVVSKTSDDGQATQCGTFSYALTKATNGSTITFGLAGGATTITFSGTLTPTVSAGVTLDGGNGNGIVLNGNGVAGDGLRLAGNDILKNLTIQHFSGREIVVASNGTISNHFYLVRVLN